MIMFDIAYDEFINNNLFFVVVVVFSFDCKSWNENNE